MSPAPGQRKRRAWFKKKLPPHQAPSLDTLETCRKAWQDRQRCGGAS
jgi:hypothetical protein